MLRKIRGLKIAKDIGGATLIYVSLMMALLMAMVGLSVDVSRFFIAQTQAQSAADAAAIAAASQLDGRPGSIARATRAAIAAGTTDPLTSNKQDFADDPTSPGANNKEVAIASIQFYETLPADDDAPLGTPLTVGAANADADAKFVEVTTETLTHNNLLLPVMNIAKKAYVRQSAVAAQNTSICRVTPFAICNPTEASGSTTFNPDDWKGKEILVKQGPGPNAAWAPGNFGFLRPQAVDDAKLNSGAKEMGELLAGIDGADQCFSTGLDMRTGQINAIRSALNTRFDIYENPHFGNDYNNDAFPPAPNVTKGYGPFTGMGPGMGPGGAACNTEFYPAGPYMGFPHDIGTEPGYASLGVAGARFGNGIWDCAAYWATNHPLGGAAPTGCNAATSQGMSRYEMYRYEIENPATVGLPGSAVAGGPEQGAPTCYAGDATQITTDPNLDRRLIHFAVMNCLEENIHGASSDKNAIAFIRAFMTTPVPDGTFDVYLEVVDAFEVGSGNDGPLKHTVEIYR